MATAAQRADFDSLGGALRTLAQLKSQPLRTTGEWDLAHVLHHAAQSVEYSMHGFPILKPAWFRYTVGPLAAKVFATRGRMSHSLTAPIPGAPDIAQGQPLGAAVDHAIDVLTAFDRYGGTLFPHFAYGNLDKAAYTRAHLLHFADHWQELDDAGH